MPEPSIAYKLILAGRLIDGKGGPPVERGAVLIEGDKIRSSGPEGSIVPPVGSQVEEFDYRDKSVLPGFVDCHVHLTGMADGRTWEDLVKLPDEVLTQQAARNARIHLNSGVTTVRDGGANNRTTFMLREAMDMGITPGPRLVLGGRPVAIIGGHLGLFGGEATGLDQCRAAVRRLLKERADFIKITATGGTTRTSHPLRPSFTVEELRAICDEAHKFGKHTAAHCASTQGMINVLDAGIDTIFHAVFSEPDGAYRFRPDVADRIANQGVFVNPTLHVGRHRVWALESKLESEGLTDQEQTLPDQLRRGYDDRVRSFAGLREAGVTMVCGSDSAFAYYDMGGFQHEVQAQVEGGMSPMEAIVSATGDSAKSCWIDRITGTLEPGKQADLLVVDGHPSQDVESLWNVVDVFQNGSLVDRGNLD